MFGILRWDQRFFTKYNQPGFFLFGIQLKGSSHGFSKYFFIIAIFLYSIVSMPTRWLENYVNERIT